MVLDEASALDSCHRQVRRILGSGDEIGLTFKMSVFLISLWWPIHIINPVDKTKL